MHLGSSNYLERYKIYVTHVREWRQQFDKLESVDLRYDRQIIVNPDLQGDGQAATGLMVVGEGSHRRRSEAGCADHPPTHSGEIAHSVNPGEAPRKNCVREEASQKSTPQSDGESVAKISRAPRTKQEYREDGFSCAAIARREHAGKSNFSRASGDRNRRYETGKQTESSNCQGRGTSISMANQ